MKNSNYKNIDLAFLPGFKIRRYTKAVFQDFLVFIIMVGVPSYFFGFVNQNVLYKPGLFDLQLLFLILTSPLIFLYFRNIKLFMNVPGSKALILLNIYIIFEIFYSMTKGIPLREIITIFRSQYFYPIACTGLLLFLSKLNNRRLNYFMYWVIIATFIQGLLFILSELTGLRIFNTMPTGREGQNFFALPLYNNIAFVFSFVSAVAFKSFKRHWLWIVPLIISSINRVRSYFFTFVLYLILTIILFLILRRKIKISNLIRITIIIVVLLFIVPILFLSQINILYEKIGINITGPNIINLGKYYSEETSYAFRIELIRKSLERTIEQGNLILGNGYIRESYPGSYDFVLGQDAPLAGVIFTEGLIGLILRWIPVILMLILSLKYIVIKNNDRYIIYYISTFVLIFPEIINIVQTTIITNFSNLLLILYVLQIMIMNNKNEQKRNLHEQLSKNINSNCIS
ncbi:MAG: hypothetical protein OP8BY_2364 [Candidatus Saccharicenans subterraneus]|uniref:Uncharacterized protein n=1 Tax=Candidatus Saccharicenans subterraneus TaxID=2508984 RepID=A0A3E2BJH4_9BACT|nr:MAG: hypothetical protein OP8BY_2364 [Candidatus Saccharicenans subterraneum]